MAREILPERAFAQGERFTTPPEAMPANENAIRYFMPKEDFGNKGTTVTLRNLFSLDGGQTWRDGGSCRFGRGRTNPRDAASPENPRPFAVFGGRPWGRARGILHKAELEVEGSDTRLALESEFTTVNIAPQHHSISIEDVQFAFASSTDTVTSPSVTPAGTDRLLIAFGGNFGSPLDPYSNMTYGGAAMTPKDDIVQQFFFRQVCEYTINPSTSGGAVEYTIASFDSTLGVVGIAYSGVDQVTPLDATEDNSASSGTSLAVAIPSAAGDEAISFIFGDATEVAVADGASSQVDQEGANAICMGVSTKTGSASVNMEWTTTSIVNGMGLIGMNVNAATGGGGGDSPAAGLRSLLGVGR